jgi:hypothetical protein
MKVRFPVALGIFLYVWLMVGFATGTATLLGPAKWITGAVRQSTWNGQEDRVMIAVILAYVALSFVFSRWLVDRMRQSRAVTVKCAIPAVATMAAGISLVGWMNPSTYARAAGGTGGKVSVKGGSQFTFGAYPDRARLEALKAEGITAVISLQHPAVMPFEPAGIEAEKKATSELGMKFVHAPMLPWVSSNQASLDIIRGLAKRGEGQYYVHCGLGRDRTNVVMRMLQGMGAGVTAPAGTPAARNFRIRLADRGNRMERGTFQELEKDVWLIPYPNHHEMYGNMLAGQVAHVLLLLSDKDKEQARWIKEAREVFTQSRVPFTVMTLWPNDRPYARKIAREAVALPRPLAVVVPFTPPRERTDVAKAFLSAYGSVAGRPVTWAAPFKVDRPAAGAGPAAAAKETASVAATEPARDGTPPTAR